MLGEGLGNKNLGSFSERLWPLLGLDSDFLFVLVVLSLTADCCKDGLVYLFGKGCVEMIEVYVNIDINVHSSLSLEEIGNFNLILESWRLGAPDGRSWASPRIKYCQ